LGPAATKAPDPTSSADAGDVEAKIARLEKELADAEWELGSFRHPLAPPKELADRFSQKAIIEALTAALKEVGSAAQLSSVDCTEYPCIAYFDGLTRKDLDALKQTGAYQAYAHDYFTTMSNTGPDGPYQALVAMPRDDPNPRNDVSARLRFRFGQMLP
jgi:hypothetical protein